MGSSYGPLESGLLDRQDGDSCYQSDHLRDISSTRWTGGVCICRGFLVCCKPTLPPWRIYRGNGADLKVVSICVAGIISLALLIHFLLAFKKPEEDTVAVRKSGQKFMVSITIFISIIALQALVFSRLEHWSYAGGIYFSIQTAFTIGYGDLTPTTTAGKVLIFPFAVLTISQLGNEISLIVAFIRERSKERRRVWRRQYEGAIHQEARLVRPRATLIEEMTLVHDINKREEWSVQSYRLRHEITIADSRAQG